MLSVKYLRGCSFVTLAFVLVMVVVQGTFARVDSQKTTYKSGAISGFNLKEPPKFVPGEIVLRLRAGYSMESLKEMNKQSKVAKINRVSLSRELEARLNGKLYGLNVPQSADILELCRKYKAYPAVLDAHPNYLYYAQIIPDDEYFDVWQWNLRQDSDADIDADLAWDETQGLPLIKIGILDTGVDPDHPDLADNLLNGYDFCNQEYWFSHGWKTVGDYGTPDDDPHDEYGHGTHVTGIISAIGNNSTGIAGLNWRSKAIPLRAGFTIKWVLWPPYEHRAVFADEDLTVAIDSARVMGCNVINMSFGGLDTCSTELYTALTFAYEEGVVLVASAGNANSTDSTYPVAYPEVIAVVSSDINDHKSWFSNYGSWVDVAAPGGTSQPGNYTAEDILSTMPTYEDFYMNTDDPVWDWSWYWPLKGTSMAAPHVAGLASLILSRNPELSLSEVKEIILNTADQVGGYDYDPETGKSLELGHGRINAYLALLATPPPSVLYVPYSYPTIQQAIDAAISGCTVQVAPGTYEENIVLKDGVDLIGSGADVTTIVGVGGDGIPLTDIPVVGASNSEIKGFTILNSGVHPWGEEWIRLANVTSAKVTGNILRGFFASIVTGILCSNSSAIISNNKIYRFCKGIESGNSDLTIENNLLFENQYDIGLSDCGLPPNNSIIINNTLVCSFDGLGIHATVGNGSVLVENNVIVDHPGGEPSGFGKGIMKDVPDNYSVDILYNDVWNNGLGNYLEWSEADSQYVPFNPTPGTGEISADPLFADSANNDFHLQGNSPCIDAGDNNALGLPQEDLDGYPRIVDGNRDGEAIVDMGAFEYQTGVGVEGGSKQAGPNEFSLGQNYPNPVNPITEIDYVLPRGCWVKLEVYNILGEKVANLVDGFQEAGYKTVRWNASSFSNGIYFYRIQAEDFSQTKKMVLLK